MSIESVPAGCVLDVEGTLARFGGDAELFVEMTGFFLEDTPPLFADLVKAVNRSDAASVRMKAHALKGLVAGCGGVRATHVAQQLESAGQRDDLSHATGLIDSLREELDLLTEAIRAYRA